LERSGLGDPVGDGGRVERLLVQQDRGGHRGPQHLVQGLVAQDLEHVALGAGVGADVAADEGVVIERRRCGHEGVSLRFYVEVRGRGLGAGRPGTGPPLHAQDWVRALYSSALSRSSGSASKVALISHPSSKGEEFTSSGSSTTAWLVSETVPLIGEKRSETDLVDSISPISVPEVISEPASGRST